MAPSESLAVLLLLVGLVALRPLSTDLYLPALPAISRGFAVGTAETQLTLSVFMAGFAVSMLVYGPLSDRFGRRPVLLAAVVLYLLASLACALAPSMEALIAAHFLQALGACAGPVVGRAVVRDIYGPHRSAKVLSHVATAMAVAPAVGPILGGYITVLFGWRATFALLVAIALVCLLAILALLPETNRFRDPHATRPGRLLSNTRSLLGSRRFLGYALVNCGAYAGIFSFISGSSFALIDGLGLSPDAFGLCFAAAVLGFMSGSFSGGRLQGRLPLDSLVALGAALGSAGGLIAAALAFAGHASVPGIVAPAALFFAGCGLMMPNALAGAIAPFPRMAGAASSLVGFIQMTSAALVGTGVGLFHDGSPRSMAVGLAGAGLVALAAYLLLLRRAAPAVLPDH